MSNNVIWWQKYKNGLCRTLTELKEAVAMDKANSSPPDTLIERFTETLPDVDPRNAPSRIANEHFLTSETQLRNHLRADWQQTDDKLKRFAGTFIETLRKHDKVPLYAHAAFRTEQQQNELNDKGVSNTRYPRAAHCQGKAVDIVHGRYHWMLTKGEWAYLGSIGKQVAHNLDIQITWGGDWSFYDPAHWELKGWQDDVQRLVPAEPIHLTPTRLRRF
jgi:hypothetical protein